MLYKDLGEDCDNCPLKQNDICSGGWQCYGGEPIEPPCCSFNDDTDLDKWVDDFFKRQRAWEDAEDRRIQAEQKRKEQNALAQKRRREAKWAVRHETNEIKTLRKRIAANEAAARLASSLAFAFNTTNEMFGYEERVEPKHKSAIEQENEKYRELIVELEAIKKEKLKQLRKQRSEKNETL